MISLLLGIAALPAFPQVPVSILVENAANYSRDALPPGTWAVISGLRLSNSTRGWKTSDFTNGGTSLPTQLDGVSVSVNGKPAFLSYVSPTQINILTPVDTATGNVTVQVNNNGLVGTGTMQLGTYDPAFFTWAPSGQVVATHSNFQLAVPPGTFANVNTTPAQPGETIILWGTGFGPTNPPFPNGIVNNNLYVLGTPVRFTVSPCSGVATSTSLTASTVALAPGFPGLYQLAVTLPADLPPSVYNLGNLFLGSLLPGYSLSGTLTVGTPTNCGVRQ
jgi:uncharacterized protein (TIGR03437 family)